MRINGGRRGLYAALRGRLPQVRAKLSADVFRFINFDGNVKQNRSGLKFRF
jgi:hypothetical protein